MPVARRMEGSAQGRWLTRWGSPLLLLSWVPFVGDLLCVAAGWLRLHWLPCGLFMALGKFVRYWVVAYALLAWKTGPAARKPERRGLCAVHIDPNAAPAGPVG